MPPCHLLPVILTVAEPPPRAQFLLVSEMLESPVLINPFLNEGLFIKGVYLLEVGSYRLEETVILRLPL